MSSNSVAIAACSETNYVGKKRRRWSTAPQDAALAPSRFAAKKQLKILGRNHPRSNSVNSLASFQSNSNPIFEPSEEPSYSSNNHNLGAEFVWYNNPPNEPTVPTPLDDLSGVGRGVESCPRSHPKPKSRLGKVSPEPPLSSNQAAVGEWKEQEGSAIIESPIQLLHSPAINGKSKRVGYGLLESREASLDYGEGQWPVGQEEVPNERGNSLLVLTSWEDGAQSIEGSSRCLIDDGAQQDEILSSVEACEKRTRDLVAKVEATAAADLAQLRTYKAIIDRLRVDCTQHEAAAKRWSDMHRDAETQLESARAKITELERQRGLQAIAIEDSKQTQDVAKNLQDAMMISEKWRLETLEKEHDGLREKVQALETELMAAKSELSAVSAREEKREAEAASERDFATRGAAEKKEEEELELGAHSKGEIDDVSKEATLQCTRGEALLAEKLSEAEAQLAAVCERMDKLQTERDELRISVQDAEKNVEEIRKERDAVVLAVQQEWDSVKVALRLDRVNLERELEVIRAQNTRLQNDLDATNRSLQEVNRQESKSLEDGCTSSLQVCIDDKVIEPGTERGDSLIALWKEYQKLEVELSEAFDDNKKQKSDREDLNVALIGVRAGNTKLQGELSDLQAEKTKLEREQDALMNAVQNERQERRKEYQKLEVELSEAYDHNKKQESDREDLNVALIGVRAGNKKLQGELSDLQVEKTKLERERGPLMNAVQNERQKLEDERAVVCKAMRGENEKLESEREVLLAMQEYLQKLQMKKDLAQTVLWGEKRRRKGKRGASTQD